MHRPNRHCCWCYTAIQTRQMRLLSRRIGTTTVFLVLNLLLTVQQCFGVWFWFPAVRPVLAESPGWFFISRCTSGGRTHRTLEISRTFRRRGLGDVELPPGAGAVRVLSAGSLSLPNVLHNPACGERGGPRCDSWFWHIPGNSPHGAAFSLTWTASDFTHLALL